MIPSEGLFDVAVVGGGMVGATAACLLARAGFTVVVIDDGKSPSFDASTDMGLRVSAISPGAMSILSEAGAWRLVEGQRHSPYRTMRVEDRDETAAIEFQAPEFGLDVLGAIVENDLVQWALWQSLRVMAGIEILERERVAGIEYCEGLPVITLDSGEQVVARLVAAADGASSKLRGLLGIGQRHWEYGQMGVVGVVRSAEPNPGVAWQRFLDGGPIAFLPLADGRSSIVWSCTELDARRRLEQDEASFVSELEAAVAGSPGHWPGALESVGPRAAFPLTMRLSDRYAARRAVLLGDAAHVMHPLAGQGVNTGLLDAAGLVEVLVDARFAQRDIGDARVLERYDRWRRSEAELMSQGVHGLRGVFLPDELGLLRRAGLGLVSRSWTVREAFIRRATGRHRNAPALARGQTLSSLVHPDS
ncbi:MAG: NAD(P)-binding protein [Xanthomonadales bacterium]|nr:FAD-dependent monooxygenase [Gammaproteobacteria bacterium]NNL05827.1 NAD(P)-binding protein [Xanthomonadales bacterium]